VQLLLKRSIEKVGIIGDVVNVKAGYARNYLLPLGLAVPVTAANLALIERERAKALAEEQARLKDLKVFADKLKDFAVTIEGRANQEGHLFGSVNAAQIAKAMTDKGFPIEEKHVRLDQPLKQIGVYTIKVHLHAELETQVKVWVVEAKG